MLWGPDANVKALQEALHEAQNRASTLSEMLSQQDALIGFLGHQMQHPVSVLRGYTGRFLAEPNAHNAGVITAELDALHGLVKQLLLMMKLKAGRVELTKNAVELGHWARRTLTELAPRLPAHAVFFVPNEIDPICLIDEAYLREVVAMLLHNAQKYTPAGTRVWLSVSVGSSTAQLHITDDGPGLSDEATQTLFDDFAQGEIHHGAGLGLSLCRSLVALHGGSISAESEKGHGTRFTIELPRIA